MIIEGSYPFITGGVSAWVHDLIGGLPELDFALFTISPSKDQEIRYELPENVIEHVDVSLADAQKITGKPKRKKELFEGMMALHDGFRAGDVSGLEAIVKQLPVGYFLYDDSINDSRGWDLITSRNELNNPTYSFSEYFWGWRSTHNAIFTLLGIAAPEADVYHAVSTGYAGLAGAVAKIRTGRALLLTEHGLYHKEREMEIKRVDYIKGYSRDMWINMFNTLSKVAYHQSDLIISLFEHNRKLQIERGAPKHRTMVIPNGIDLERFSVDERDERSGFHIALIGRVVPIKDVKTFIIAAKNVVDRVPEAHFHCVGPTDEDPGYFNDCQLLVSNLKLEDNFSFTGRQDVREYYKFIDVLVLTSIREAQPLVILEAYAAGVLVVSTRVGNVPELLDYDERFLANQKDTEKISSGIIYIHDHPDELAQIVARNKRTVSRFYERRGLHQRYRKIYFDHLPAADGKGLTRQVDAGTESVAAAGETGSNGAIDVASSER